MTTKLSIVLCLSLIGLVAIYEPDRALGQGNVFRDAGAKIRGDAYWPARATTRYIDSARNYAQDFHTYVAKNPSPEPSVVKEVNLELSRYLGEAKKHLASMKKDFAGDKETRAAIENIEKGLAAAVEHHKAMIECCENEKFDKIAGMTCCSDLVKELDKIHAEHQDLMRKLSRQPAAPATKK